MSLRRVHEGVADRFGENVQEALTRSRHKGVQVDESGQTRPQTGAGHGGDEAAVAESDQGDLGQVMVLDQLDHLVRVRGQ